MDVYIKSTVTVRGQVSIPVKIRERFNIEPETKVEWIVDGNTLKVISLPKDPVFAFRGKGTKHYTTKDLLIDRKNERVLEIEKEGK